ETVVESRTTVVPAVADVICTVHEPVFPTVVQVFTPPTNEPGPNTVEGLITVPAGAFTKPETVLTFTWPVNVWFVRTTFVAVAGVIWMFASTQFFCAFGLSPAFASPVSRCNGTPLTVTSVAAFATVTPGVAEVICTVHEPVPPAVVQVFTPPTN